MTPGITQAGTDQRPGRGAALRVGGLTPLTTIDYPGALAAVVFCQGCPWRCRYCHNAHLIPSDASTSFEWPAVQDFLRRRQGLLDAVVFSGGEPMAQHALADALDEVRRLGFKTGLHTNGAYPQRLHQLLPKLDWIGLDIKALAEDYPALTGVPHSGDQAWQSLDMLQNAAVPFDVRVTVHDALLPQPKLDRLLKRLRAMQAPEPKLQPCRDQGMLDSTLGRNGYMS